MESCVLKDITIIIISLCPPQSTQLLLHVLTPPIPPHHQATPWTHLSLHFSWLPSPWLAGAWRFFPLPAWLHSKTPLPASALPLAEPAAHINPSYKPTLWTICRARENESVKGNRHFANATMLFGSCTCWHWQWLLNWKDGLKCEREIACIKRLPLPSCIHIYNYVKTCVSFKQHCISSTVSCCKQFYQMYKAWTSLPLFTPCNL